MRVYAFISIFILNYTNALKYYLYISNILLKENNYNISILTCCNNNREKVAYNDKYKR